MSYYILYPKSVVNKVKIITKRPTGRQYWKKYGFCEGSFKNKCSVIRRLNMMNVPVERRPEKWQDIKVC